MARIRSIAFINIVTASILATFLVGCAKFSLFGDHPIKTPGGEVIVHDVKLPVDHPVKVEGTVSTKNGVTVFDGSTKKTGGIAIDYLKFSGIIFIIITVIGFIMNGALKTDIIPERVLKRSFWGGIGLLLLGMVLGLYGWIIALVALAYGIYLIIRWYQLHPGTIKRVEDKLKSQVKEVIQEIQKPNGN